MAKKQNFDQQVKTAVVHHYGTKVEDVVHTSDVSISVFDRFNDKMGNIVIAKDENGKKYVTTTQSVGGLYLDPYKTYCQNIITITNEQGDDTNGITYNIQCDGKTVTLNFPNN